jgi:uncharacterized Zn finger protein
MTDILKTCPKCKAEQSCYVLPINETKNSYNCLACGFVTNDLLKADEYDQTTYESEMPELFKDIKHTDESGRVWYPNVINLEGKGTVFPNGSSGDDWQWSAIKSIPLTEEEVSNVKFKGKTHKSDSKTLKDFGFDYFAACDYIGLYEVN